MATTAGGMTYERTSLANGMRVLTAPMPHVQSTSCFLMFAAGLPLRDEGVERDRALRRAHVLQGHRAPAARARHHERDRLDRRRVQRVHRQGVHGLLRQVRGRARARRIRRARRHAPPLEVRAGGDRAREGRDRRGDEHVLRHAARLHRRPLRLAPLRRPAARLGHHRLEGHGARRDARHVPRLPRPLVPADADGRRRRRQDRRRLVAKLEALLGDLAPADAGPGPRPARHERGPRVLVHTKPSDQAHVCSACAATRSRTRTATRCSCCRPCSAAGCPRACSPRCASAAGSRTTCSASTTLHRRGLALRAGAASTSTASTTRSRRSSAR